VSRCGPGLAPDWDRRYADDPHLWGDDANRFLVAEVEGLPPGRALDLACGAGRNAVWLAERGWKVTAVDFSTVGLERAAHLAVSHGVEVDWLLADLLEYEPPAQSFDLVIVLYLQLPADARRLVLGRAADAVAPGGTFLLVGHDLANLEGGYGGPTNPAVLYTPEEVAADLTGFVLEKAASVVRRVEVEEGEREAIDALVRARRD
jgi:SAM-dependent methyltransferase